MLVSAAVAHALAVLLAAQELGGGFDARVQVASVAALGPGESGELSVTILDDTEPGLPLSVRLRASEIVLTDNRLDVRDVVDPQAQQPRMRARFVAPDEPGRYEVEGLVEYITCQAERCRPRRIRVVWVIEVLAAVLGPTQ